MVVDTQVLIDQVEDRLGVLIARQESLRSELHALQLESAELYGRLASLRELMDEFSPVERQETVPASADSWTDYKMTDSVERALIEAGSPIGPMEVAAIFARHGRERANVPTISATLDYLKRKGRAVNIGRGQWTLAVTPERVAAQGVAESFPDSEDA
jgi:hypothetical protein